MNRFLRAALGVNAASLAQLARSGPRQVFRASGRAFVAASDIPPESPYRIPEIHLVDILGDRKPVIKLAVRRYEDGMLPTDQAMALLAILVAENPTSVLEIGTFMGHTTRQMAENLEAAVIHTVDLPEEFSEASDTNSQHHLPKDDFHLIRSRVVGRELLARAWVLGHKQPIGRRLEVVGLVDLCQRLDRVVVTLDEHAERRHLGRIVLVEHHLPEATVRRPDGDGGASAADARGRSRVRHG